MTGCFLSASSSQSARPDHLEGLRGGGPCGKSPGTESREANTQEEVQPFSRSVTHTALRGASRFHLGWSPQRSFLSSFVCINLSSCGSSFSSRRLLTAGSVSLGEGLSPFFLQHITAPIQTRHTLPYSSPSQAKQKPPSGSLRWNMIVETQAAVCSRLPQNSHPVPTSVPSTEWNFRESECCLPAVQVPQQAPARCCSLL